MELDVPLRLPLVRPGMGADEITIDQDTMSGIVKANAGLVQPADRFSGNHGRAGPMSTRCMLNTKIWR